MPTFGNLSKSFEHSLRVKLRGLSQHTPHLAFPKPHSGLSSMTLVALPTMLHLLHMAPPRLQRMVINPLGHSITLDTPLGDVQIVPELDRSFLSF